MLISDIVSLLTDVPVILIYSLFIATLLNQKFMGRGIARVIFFYPVIMATGFMSAIDTDNAMTTLGKAAIDSSASADLSNMAEITGMLSSLYFPERQLLQVLRLCMRSVLRSLHSGHR